MERSFVRLQKFCDDEIGDASEDMIQISDKRWNRWCIRGYNSDIWQETRMLKVHTSIGWMYFHRNVFLLSGLGGMKIQTGDDDKCAPWNFLVEIFRWNFLVEIFPPGIQPRSLFRETHLEYHVTQVMIHMNFLGKKALTILQHFEYCIVCVRGGSGNASSW